jgi:hypothetical protein
LTRRVAINIRKGNTARLTTEILEILPARVARNARYNQPNSRRSSGASTVASVAFVHIPTRSTFLGKLNYDVCAHESFTIEIMHGVLGVPCIFKLDEAKAGHDSAIHYATVAVEKFCNII